MKKRGGGDAVEAYLREMAAELDALGADVKKTGRRQLLPLDLSYASLDRAEDYYRLLLGKRVTGKAAKAAERLTRYAGATLIENAGGAWAVGPSEDDPFCVTRLSTVPKAQFLPASTVAYLANSRFVGGLREQVERYDLRLQRARIAELSSDLGATFARLRADAKELCAKDPGAFDGDLASLDRLEAVFRLVNGNKARPELRRRLRRGAAIYLGCVLQGQLGESQWSVEDEPRNAELGNWKIFDFVVSGALGLVGVKEAGVLRRKIETIVADRSKRSKKKP